MSRSPEPPRRRLLPYGEDAVLLELDGESAVEVAAAVAGHLSVVEAVPGASTVLAIIGEPARLDVVGRELLTLEVRPAQIAEPTQHVLPVVYDGEDLDAVAEEAGLSVDGVVGLHAEAVFTVAFCGFAPGFAYLTGLPEALRCSRLPSPRRAVPAGSVAIADTWSGVYPRTSPGGWRLLGRLAVPDPSRYLFDPDRPDAALLRPGDQVRFSR